MSSTQGWSYSGVCQGVSWATFGDSKHGRARCTFCFLDGLRGWAKIELKRHAVQDLASAVVTVESLIEFKRESSKLWGKKTYNMMVTVTETRTSLLGGTNQQYSRTKGREGKEGWAPRKYSCFLYNGPHRIFKCLKHGKLIALVTEEERQQEEKHIALILLLNAI